MESSTASTALPASRRVRPLFVATLSTNSCFVTCSSSSRPEPFRHPNRPFVSAQPCGFAALLPCREDFLRREQAAQTYSLPRELFLAALLAVDHADRRFAYEAALAERLDGRDQGPAGGDDVLHQADPLALLEDPFDALAGAVLLRRLAHEEERQTGRERRRGGEGDRAELGAGEPVGAGLELGCGGGDALAERREQLGPGLEPVLVEVVLRALAGAEHEITLQVRDLLDPGAELGVVHGRALRSAVRASSSSASPSALPGSREIIVPSAKWMSAFSILRAVRWRRRNAPAAEPAASARPASAL